MMVDVDDGLSTTFLLYKIVYNFEWIHLYTDSIYMICMLYIYVYDSHTHMSCYLKNMNKYLF